MRFGFQRAVARASARWVRWFRLCPTAFSTPRCAAKTSREIVQTDSGRGAGRGAAALQRSGDAQKLSRARRESLLLASEPALCCTNAVSSILKTFASICCTAAMRAARKAFVEMIARRDLQDDSQNPACAVAAAADFPPGASGKRRGFRIRPRNTSSATATRATRARS